jgi:hypothetical protein
MAFQVGQKVTRIDDKPWRIRRFSVRAPTEGPVFGVVYVVVDIEHYEDCQYLSFSEFDGAAFDERRFRPVVEGETDISIFRRMLNPAGAPKEPATRHSPPLFRNN